MLVALSLTDKAALTVLRNVLLEILPDGTEVIRAQENRVPEPVGDDFVTMTPTFRKRLATNQDEYDDCYFTASIAGDVMTVSDISFGTLVPGRQMFGLNLADNTTIVAQLTGPDGGLGTYSISPDQTVTSQMMAAGGAGLMQETAISIQLDVHGPNSPDNAQKISTIFRDAYGYDLFAPLVSGVSPLYADDPRQAPFTNDQQQVENRWMIESVVQVNPVVTLPQQFAGALSVELIDVDAIYPAI